MQNVTNLGTLRETVKILNIHKTGAKKIRDVLLCDVLHKEMDEYEKSMVS